MWEGEVAGQEYTYLNASYKHEATVLRLGVAPLRWFFRGGFKMLFVQAVSLILTHNFQVLAPYFPVTNCFGVEEVLMASGSLQNEHLSGDEQDKGPPAPH